MPSGGARSRSGPAADPNALRRNRTDDAEWITLPAEGRQAAAPEFPLPTNEDPDMARREATLWESFWKKPQAVAWERFGLTHDVALYVRRLAEAELPGSNATLSTLVRQMGDALGISVPGMRSLRWTIAGTADAASIQTASTSKKSAKNRFRVVTDGDA